MRNGVKVLLTLSIILAVLTKLMALYFVDLVWISIILYALLVFRGYNKNLSVTRNIILINLPFLIFHVLPLAIHHYVFNLYHYNPPHLLYNYAALMAYTQICIGACLIIRVNGVPGLLYSLVFALVIYIGYESWSLQVFVAGTAFLSMSIFLRFSPEKTMFHKFIFLFLPFFCFYILNPLWEPLFMGGKIAYWNSKVLPVMLVVPTGIIAGLFLKYVTPITRYISLVVIIALFALAARLNMTWIAFVSQDKTQRELLAPLALTDYYGDTVQLETRNGDMLVLNLWSTSCGICIKKFPEIEKLHNDFLDDPRVNIYSINIPLRRDTKEFISSFTKDYDTPLLFGDEALRDKLGVDGYPTMIIIKNGEQKYHGITVFDPYNYYDSYRLIDRLLYE